VFFRADSRESAWALLEGLGRGMGEFTVQHAYLLSFALLFSVLSWSSDAFERAVVGTIERWRGWRLALATTSTVFFIILFGPSGVPAFIYYSF